jgi:hypothetical protein
MMRGLGNVRAIGTAATFAAVVLFAGAARGDDVTLLSPDEAVPKLANRSPVLVLSSKEGTDEEKAFKAALSDKKLAKAVKDVLAVRLDTGDEEAAKKLGLTPAKAARVDVLDGYGLLVSSHDGKPTTELLASLLQKADEATKKKNKVEKAMDGAVAKGEAALKNDDTRAACDIFSAVVEHEKDVPCKATASARKHLDELAAKGAELLAKAREEMGNDDFARAHKAIAEAQDRYPLPSVKEEAKKLRDELAAEEAKQK